MGKQFWKFLIFKKSSPQRRDHEGIVKELPETKLKSSGLPQGKGRQDPGCISENGHKSAPQKPCRPRYNLHLYGQVGCLQRALSLPTSNRRRQSGGLRTTN
jgi:hypothetical protein